MLPELGVCQTLPFGAHPQDAQGLTVAEYGSFSLSVQYYLYINIIMPLIVIVYIFTPRASGASPWRRTAPSRCTTSQYNLLTCYICRFPFLFALLSPGRPGPHRVGGRLLHAALPAVRRGPPVGKGGAGAGGAAAAHPAAGRGARLGGQQPQAIPAGTALPELHGGGWCRCRCRRRGSRRRGRGGGGGGAAVCVPGRQEGQVRGGLWGACLECQGVRWATGSDLAKAVVVIARTRPAGGLSLHTARARWVRCTCCRC